jgi:hypothetical protein
VNSLPKNLTHLIFETCLNQLVDIVPKNLTFGDCFNQEVKNLPKNLTHLTFGYTFNQLVDNLPNKLTELTFGDCFNQGVDNLPNNLTHLTFGRYFNQSVDSLPDTIKELTYWSESKLNNIPTSIEYTNIIFTKYDKYNKVIDNLPINVKIIRINKPDKAHYLKKIPFGCKVVDENEKEIFI